LKDPDLAEEARRYDMPIASRKFILQTMEDTGEPMAFKRIAKELGLEERWQRDALQNRLRAMVRDGQLVADRRNVYAIAGKMELVRGRVSGHIDGYGFLIPEGEGDDVFLGHRQMRGVFHGDIALVRIRGIDRRGRAEGEIVEVLERRTTQLAGRLYFENHTWFLESLNNRITQEILVQPDERLEQGKIVSAQVVDQPSAHGIASCAVEEILGDHLTPEMEITIALRNHEIPYEFPEEVLAGARELPDAVAESHKANRADLRDLPFVTIDGADAKDFDDAIYCEARSRGGWKLFVAIADVAHYVGSGSALDDAAYERGTSVYFPQHVVPMLPEELSNGLCSLKPDVDRLVLVCEMTLSARGRISNFEFYEGVMHSAARLIYEQVAAGEADGAWRDSLDETHKLLNTLLKSRQQRGALDFDSTELAFEFTDSGEIESISRRGRNIAHQLIEECMLCANVCAARFLDKLEKTGLYRVHEHPEEAKIENLRSFLQSVGVSLPEGILKPADFQNALLTLRGKPNGHVLQVAILRSLSQAVYQVPNAGHFGLNYPMYTHFTSPIRRYPDLLTHRMIKSVIHSDVVTDHVRRFAKIDKTTARSYDYATDQLVALGEHCSFTERRAETAVYEVIEWMKCEYVATKVGSIEPGIITGVTSFGLFVELSEVLIEGLIHVSNLIDDYYHFDKGSQTLVGEKSGLSFGIGDNVSVQVARVSVDERKIDFELVSHDPITRGRAGTAKGSRSDSGDSNDRKRKKPRSKRTSQRSKSKKTRR
jgi:ribonuclease R